MTAHELYKALKKLNSAIIATTGIDTLDRDLLSLDAFTETTNQGGRVTLDEIISKLEGYPGARAEANAKVYLAPMLHAITKEIKALKEAQKV